MALVTDKPADVASSNDLDGIEVPADGTPPAFLKFGTTNCAIENPPAYGETRTYKVMVHCSAEHGPIERADGEERHERSLKIRLCWEDGKPKPPDPDEDQPGLFDEGGNTAASDGGDDA